MRITRRLGRLQPAVEIQYSEERVVGGRERVVVFWGGSEEVQLHNHSSHFQELQKHRGARIDLYFLGSGDSACRLLRGSVPSQKKPSTNYPRLLNLQVAP